MNFEEELAKRARARARRNSSTTTPAALTTVPTTPTLTQEKSNLNPISSPSPTPTATAADKELSYEDILAGRDFGSPDVSSHRISLEGIDRKLNDNNRGDDEDEEGSPNTSSTTSSDGHLSKSHRQPISSSSGPPSTAPTAVGDDDDDDDDMWDTGMSPGKFSSSFSHKDEDDFFRVSEHPSLTNSVDGPSEMLLSSDNKGDDGDEDDDEDEDDERREDLMEHERRRRASTSVQYDAPQQLAVEYIIRREEAHAWLRRMLVPAGLHKLSESLLSVPSKLAQGLCNGVVLCEVIRCLRGLQTDQMVIHRMFPPAIAKMRASDNIRTFLEQCSKLGLPNHALFQLDDLLDTHGNSDGGNFGMVLYSLGALARFSVSRQIIKPSLGWSEVGLSRTERVFTVEEVTEASVELLMHDGDAGTPILNFTAQVLPKVDRRRGSVMIVRSRDVVKQNDRIHETGVNNRYGLDRKEFQRRQSLIQGNLVVTRANINDNDEIANNERNGRNGKNGGNRGDEDNGNVYHRRRYVGRSSSYQLIAEEPNIDVPGDVVRVVVSEKTKRRGKTHNGSGHNSSNNDNLLDKLKRCAMGPMSTSRSPILSENTRGKRQNTHEREHGNNTATTNCHQPSSNTTNSNSSLLTTSWHLRTLQRWLNEDIGLPEYTTMFQQHGWDNVDAVLDLLDVAESERMGITKRGHVLRIQRGLPRLRHYRLLAKSTASSMRGSGLHSANGGTSSTFPTSNTDSTSSTSSTSGTQSAARTRSLVEDLETMSDMLMSSNLDHSTLSNLSTLINSTRSTVAPGWHSNGRTSGPAVVIDIGAHETRVEVVTLSAHNNSNNSTTTAVVVPSVVGRRTTTFRRFRHLEAPGAVKKRKIEKSDNDAHPVDGEGSVVAVGVDADGNAEECWLRSVVDVGAPILIDADDDNNENGMQSRKNSSLTSRLDVDTNERIHVDDLVPLLDAIFQHHHLPLRAAENLPSRTSSLRNEQHSMATCSSPTSPTSPTSPASPALPPHSSSPDSPSALSSSKSSSLLSSKSSKSSSSPDSSPSPSSPDHPHLACHPIVLIDSFPLFDKSQRASVVHELFEKFGVPSIAIVPHATSVLVAHGLSTGLVVDIGETSTRVTPVVDGVPLREWIRRSMLCGRTLTDRTLLHMVHKGYPFRSFAEPQRADGHVSGNTHLQRRVAQHVKQSLCCVRTIKEGTEERREKAINESDWPHQLRGFLQRSRQHEFVVWREARAQVTECLFDPHESMSGGGVEVGGAGSVQRKTLHGLVFDVLSNMSPKVSGYFFSCFYIDHCWSTLLWL